VYECRRAADFGSPSLFVRLLAALDIPFEMEIALELIPLTSPLRRQATIAATYDAR